MLVVSKEATVDAPNYNEASIRFHVIDPILRLLGYPDSEDTYLFLEEKLDYPYIHVGRRSKKDLPLGFADYRAGIKGARGSFIVEAKSGAVQISEIEIEQAHSYAAHAQVSANYFVLCNGASFQVYETLSGPKADPIVDLPLSDVNSRFHEIDNILSPDALRRNCKVHYDTGLKLAQGLGSSVRVRSGKYDVVDYKLRVIVDGQDHAELVRKTTPQFSAIEDQIELFKSSFVMRVATGFAERDADGRIVAHVEFDGATVQNHQAMVIMGIDEATFVTSDKFISIDPSNPTISESIKDFTVSRGTSVPQLFGGSTVMEGDVEGDLYIRIAMFFQNNTLLGEYISFSKQQFSMPGLMPFELELEFVGTFELKVD